MTDAIKYGSFFPKDQNGFIINPARLRTISSPWDNLLPIVVEAFLAGCQKDLVGVYLRGSVALNAAVPGISDLDCFGLVVQPGLRWEVPVWANALGETLDSMVSFPLELDCRLASYNQDFVRERPFLAMVIQSQSLCLYGEDIREDLPAVKPGPAMMIDYRWYAQDLKAFSGKLADPGKISIQDFRDFMKTTLRVGFELIMEDLGEYTRDLGVCYRSFSEFYPEKQPAMKKAIQWFLNPVIDRESLAEWVHEFGLWLAEKTQEMSARFS